MSEETRRIVNTWDQLQRARLDGVIHKKHALAITYRPSARHNAGSGVVVWSPFFETDPDAAWYHHKRKWFGHDRAAGFEEARAWVAETYGYTGTWVGNAMRDQVPQVVQKKYPIKRHKKLDVPAAS